MMLVVQRGLHLQQCGARFGASEILALMERLGTKMQTIYNFSPYYGSCDPHLCWERHLYPALQDVISGDLYRARELQILQDQMIRDLWKHFLDLMGLRSSSKSRLITWQLV